MDQTTTLDIILLLLVGAAALIFIAPGISGSEANKRPISGSDLKNILIPLGLVALFVILLVALV